MSLKPAKSNHRSLQNSRAIPGKGEQGALGRWSVPLPWGHQLARGLSAQNVEAWVWSWKPAAL